VITAEEARTIWRYDPETGFFFWLVKPPHSTRQIGDRAGSDNGRGNRLCWRAKYYRAARVAWLMVTGEWPIEVDHEDTDPWNDKWDNLREATRSQNSANKGAYVTNKLGVKGVCFHKKGFQASIGFGPNYEYLGRFQSVDQAKAAYDAAAFKRYGDFARSA
jgi:hypothetical protein